MNETSDELGAVGALSGRGSAFRRLPRLLVMVAAALFIALLAYGLTTTSSKDSIDQLLREGKTAPAAGFSLAVLEPGQPPPRLLSPLSRYSRDGRLSLDELRGTPVVLNFWASWCSPCRLEATRLEQGWRRWGRRGVLFLGIDMQDLTGDARDFLRRQSVTYPTIRDPGKDVAKSYGATGIPETYFISARGRVVAHVIGVVSDEQVDSATAAALAGRAIGRKRGGAVRPPR
jgi:cytochrome c biogenesis protein CcmG/thiol:disulfide interchange protein DsbE